MGQCRLAAARHVFLNIEVGQCGTPGEVVSIAETVQAALPTGVEVEFGAVLVEAIRDTAARVLLVAAEGREADESPRS